ncbi:aldo/keto reductase [Eubacteriales bacterium OttesenSCG-928-N13]|nr:aldo/keto reductase [Eubacteriales bacterium OttesenSCG-928-N13]
MQYRTMKSTGDRLSILGFGCMRFPTKGVMTPDTERIEQQIVSAIHQGVNYFDTAYTYPNSENVLGSVLAKGYRDKVKIATKLPLPLVHKREDIERFFVEQLQRLQTDHIDYYLMHGINTYEDWLKLKGLGIEEFIKTEQANGRIINIGFSFHGNIKAFKQLVDDYPWDFCQIQYNYVDENFQAGTEGLHYAHEKGLGIIIMEPLRGGTLIGKMPPKAQQIMDGIQPKQSPAALALRWVWNHPEVSVVLSGMNAEAHIEENVKVASTALPDMLTQKELDALDDIKAEFEKNTKVPCTGCAYCMPCPFGVDIPYCFAMYNSKSMFGGLPPVFHYLSGTSGAKSATGTVSRASQCKHCGACEAHCPQHIPIRKHLKDASNTMETWYYKALNSVFDRVMHSEKKS